MATSIEVESLKESVRNMPASKKKGDAIFNLLEMWIPLQQKDDWLALINEKTRKLNQREIAAELCATDNIWKKERFKVLLAQMNSLVKDSGYIEVVCPEIKEQESEVAAPKVEPNGEGKPIQD
jgi:hypothetical protein